MVGFVALLGLGYYRQIIPNFFNNYLFLKVIKNLNIIKIFSIRKPKNKIKVIALRPNIIKEYISKLFPIKAVSGSVLLCMIFIIVDCIF